MFKKLLTYFLLLNFLNTVCFLEVPVQENMQAAAFLWQETQPDEIDSMVEFLAEYCLDLNDDFSDTDFDDVPDDLKTRSMIKDLLLPEIFVFQAPVNFSVSFRANYACRFPANWSKIDSPPPKKSLV